MKIKIRRYNVERPVPSYWQDYEVADILEGATVMQILDYIAENIDGSIAYYRHSACMHGICGRCALKVNGKIKLSCICVPNVEVLILEPANEKIWRDLVCK